MRRKGNEEVTSIGLWEDLVHGVNVSSDVVKVFLSISVSFISKGSGYELGGRVCSLYKVRLLRVKVQRTPSFGGLSFPFC